MERTLVTLHRIQLFALVAIAVALFSVSAQAETPNETPVIGYVFSLTGDAVAHQPGYAPRNLACGDPVRSGDVVITLSGSIAVSSPGLYTRIDAETEVQLMRHASGVNRVAVAEGGLRILDARPEADRAITQIVTSGADLSPTGRDVEVFVSPDGSTSEVCEWDQGSKMSGACTRVERFKRMHRSVAEAPRVDVAPEGELCSWKLALGPKGDLISASDWLSDPWGLTAALARIRYDELTGLEADVCEESPADCSGILELSPVDGLGDPSSGSEPGIILDPVIPVFPPGS